MGVPPLKMYQKVLPPFSQQISWSVIDILGSKQFIYSSLWKKGKLSLKLLTHTKEQVTLSKNDELVF